MKRRDLRAELLPSGRVRVTLTFENWEEYERWLRTLREADL